MTEEEIYEELEITYGKPPRTTSEKNMIWLKGVLEELIETRGGREIIARGFDSCDADNIKRLLSF